MAYHRLSKRHLASLGGAFLMLITLLIPPLAPAARALPTRQTTDPRVSQIMAGMSLRQKVAQMFVVSLWGEVLTLDSEAFLQEYQPGGVALFGYNAANPAQITNLTNAIQHELVAAGTSPAWIAIDQEGGMVQRLSAANGFTSFPVNMAVAATGNPAYAQAIGQAMAEELRAVGINMNLAPVADVETNPDNPVIFRRAYSADATQTGAMVAAMVTGLQSGGVLATAKHFPGHGDTAEDSHVELPVVTVDRARLDNVELVPFRRAIEANVGAIMVSHIWYPALEPAELPASLSPRITNDLLRQELGYAGLIMTDALDMDAVDARYSLNQAAVLAIQAGADLVTPGPHVGLDTQRGAIDAVVTAVEAGEITPATIDTAVTRILTLKLRYGVLDWAPLDPATAAQRLDLEAHTALIQEILSSAVTLAFDRGLALPLESPQRVALIYPATSPSLTAACEPYHPDLRFVGVSLGPTAEEIGWAVEAAEWAEAAIVFTSDAHRNPDLQTLVNALPAEKTVVVAQRSPYDLKLFPSVAAYLLTYSPQFTGAEAACRVLFGYQPANGRLPVSLGEDLLPGSGILLQGMD